MRAVDVQRGQLTAGEEMHLAEHIVMTETSRQLHVIVDRQVDVLARAIGKQKSVLAARALLTLEPRGIDLG